MRLEHSQDALVASELRKREGWDSRMEYEQGSPLRGPTQHESDAGPARIWAPARKGS